MTAAGTTTMTTTTDHRQGISVRTRILAWILFVVGVALCVVVLITGRTYFTQIDATIAAEHAHEANKLRAFAAEPNDKTGKPFTSVREMLTDYLMHNAPARNQTLFSIVDGTADRRSSQMPLVRLDRDTDFVAKASAVAHPDSGRVDTEAGAVAYSVVPVRVVGDSTEGALVMVDFLGPAHADAWSTIQRMGLGSGFALVLAGGVGWIVAGRALRPIRDVQTAAASISSTDLDQRIEVVGTDDVARLATTFNGMLDRLEGAFDTQRRFLDDAGHELRTPITVVRGHLDLLSAEPEERAKSLHLVDDELRRMSRLVDEVLLLARAERPDFLVIGPVNLTELVAETLSKATALAPRKWSVDAVPEGVTYADGQRLAQALLQLATNAVSATKEGDVIAVGGAVQAGKVHLWVRDHGIGIPAADQLRIFDRFVRGDSARRHPGSGLGLAIVSRIAHAHEGKVAVESDPGEGSIFTVTLPYCPREIS